jgi:hypothetical protein
MGLRASNTNMVTERAFFCCFLCRQRFSADPEIGEGTFISAWKVAVCSHCLIQNKAGLPLSHPSVARLALGGVITAARGKALIAWPVKTDILNDDLGCQMMEEKGRL